MIAKGESLTTCVHSGIANLISKTQTINIVIFTTLRQGLCSSTIEARCKSRAQLVQPMIIFDLEQEDESQQH